ncbi:Scr1 family TA system antitoxin-like transcriptional regulator [Solwaraspora sp. WMMD1047]|uniref:Scr1 family TA system antitoxin-like transcriptional regulator n=1 Tax=Solwaraspora sp. WMMD1047 TaxID=3016102 RepID=UPI0024160325|nr:Scr1 family TA system antitoxin-like transcriptional regulator [Solwaraspora sp. WMMD1047]MDG4828668.1 Scr1 family TA system antitoxin-like transcriptional regulator [Solwaraspora sp. WMMD1047]
MECWTRLDTVGHLTRRPEPPATAAPAAPGGPDVMREQLAHVVAVAQDMRHVSIQVLPFDQGIFPGMLASFTLMDFRPPDGSIVFSEGLTGAIHEETEEAARYRIIFDELRAAALSKADSIRLMEQLMHELI